MVIYLIYLLLLMKHNSANEEVVWDEPANPPAGANFAAQGVAQSQDERRRITLALETTLAELGVVDGVYLVVEDVPHDVRLSAGRWNGNETWSIGPGELDKLHAIVPSSRSAAFALRVRVLCPDPHGYEYASTVAHFDIVIEQDSARTAGLPKRKAQSTGARSLADTVVAVATGSRQLALVTDPSAPEDWRTAAERRLVAARQAWHPDDEGAVARMHAEWEAAEQERRAARVAATLRYHVATLADLEEQQRQRQAARASMAKTLKSARLAAQERTTAILPAPEPTKQQAADNPPPSATGWMLAGLAGVGLACAVLAVFRF